MGKITNIEWSDSTCNFTSGCDGCELWKPGKGGSCYAGNYHEGRMHAVLPQLYAANFDEVRLIPGRMHKAAGWSDLRGTDRPDKPWLNDMPRVIFVGDMGDAMSRAVPFEYLKAELIDIATSARGRRHIWMLLTKQPARLAEFSSWLGSDLPENIWAGTSITARASLPRIGHLRNVPAETRFLSIEPLVEDPGPMNLEGISLVIIGCESGPGHREMKTEWAESIVAQCREAGVAVFVKQMVVDGKVSGEIGEFPAGLRVREFPRSL